MQLEFRFARFLLPEKLMLLARILTKMRDYLAIPSS